MARFPCVTDGCGGLIRQATLLEGAGGQDLRNRQYEMPGELEAALQAERQRSKEEADRARREQAAAVGRGVGGGCTCRFVSLARCW